MNCVRTIGALLVLCATSCSRSSSGPGGGEELCILVQPLGDISAAQVDSVAAALRREHGAQVIVANGVDLPAHAFVRIKSPRYRADTLIAWLRDRKPDSVDHVIGLTAQDISITKYADDGTIKEPVAKYRDFGIYGLGYMGGASCVVSSFRFGGARHPAFFSRLCKVAVHEVGHNRGLDHCSDTTCVMRDAVERMASVDAEGRSFCAACRRSL